MTMSFFKARRAWECTLISGERLCRKRGGAFSAAGSEKDVCAISMTLNLGVAQQLERPPRE